MASHHRRDTTVKPLFFKTVQAAFPALRRLAYWVGLGICLVAFTMSLLFIVARAAIRPMPGTWATTLHAGPLAVDIGVATFIWLGTTPWLARQLDAHTFATRIGPLRVGWDDTAQTLSLQCKPCTLSNPSWGAEPLRLAEVRVSVQRKGMQLHGQVSSGAVKASWRGQLTTNSLLIDIDLPPTAVRDGYALFAQAIPELARAQISGTFALRANLSLPSGLLTWVPRLEGMTVQGLGTEQWANASSACGNGLAPLAQAVALKPNSLLARAVIATEDQRFFEHPGYDLIEITHALHNNQREANARQNASVTFSGASTLSQQVAKLLVTGGERAPVRKLRELLYAVEMEQTLGKARILRLYLDNAPWGVNVCGAQAAANTYFGKRADRLTVPEAAWLAAMLHNPVMEARRWAATGQINLPRAQRVARALRSTASR